MPTYSYACTECGDRFDVVQSFSDDALTACEKCAGRLRKLFGNVGVVFKGSGFYRNDSREASKSPNSSSSGSNSSNSEGSSSESSGSGEKSSSTEKSGSGEKSGSSEKPQSSSEKPTPDTKSPSKSPAAASS